MQPFIFEDDKFIVFRKFCANWAPLPNLLVSSSAPTPLFSSPLTGKSKESLMSERLFYALKQNKLCLRAGLLKETAKKSS